MESVRREEFGRQRNETGLIELTKQKQLQAAEAAVMARIQNDPEVARQLFGDSIIGSLMQPQAPPGAGPITQSPLGGGPGQQIPAYPDASRYAGVSPQGGGPLPAGVGMPTVTPPQSVIGSLGPAGQPQMQPPRNPLLEMAQRDPRAAMMLQQQMHARELQQLTMHEKHLDLGVKVAEGVARQLQGVTNQETLDQAREQVHLIHPQAAAQIPQLYSKEAVESLKQRGIAVADQAKNRHYEAQSRKLDVESSMLPKLYDRITQPDEAAPASESAPTTPARAPAGIVPGVEKLSQPFRTKADSIADRLGANRDDFLRVMHFETGGEMSPATTNRAGSGATGLIQFTPETAKRLGTTTEALAKMSPEQQLDYVEKYLEPHKGKIGNLKDLYMAVLYPAAIGKSEDTVLFSPDKTPAAYRQNAGLDSANKGYVTVGDAVAAVERSTGGARSASAGGRTGTAQAPATDPRIAQLEAKIAKRTQDSQLASLAGNESLSTRLNDDANRLKDERTRLLAESQRQQERAEEIPRAAQKQTAELEAKQQFERQRQAGPLLPEDRRKHLAGLRENVLKEPTFKIYQDVRNGYQNVKVGAASDSAQGDLAIFNGLAKILDPTSSVMSGEAKNIEEAQGQLQIWFNSPAKFLEGDRISAENRPRFLKMAHDLAKEKLTTAQTELKTVWGPLAQEVGIDFNQVVPLPDLTPLGPGPNVSKFEKALEGK
jgi:hypothetical protein